MNSLVIKIRMLGVISHYYVIQRNDNANVETVKLNVAVVIVVFMESDPVILTTHVYVSTCMPAK